MFEYAKDELKLIRRGSRPIDRLRLAGMSLWFHLAAHGMTPPGGGRGVLLQLRGVGTIRARPSDYFIMFELFGLDGYDIDLSPIGRISSVLDIGANIGLATIFLSRRHPAARFHCAEPARGSFGLLRANLARNVPDAGAIQAAALAEPGRVQIDEGRFPALDRVRATATEEGIRGATIPQLLDEAGFADVDLLKLDVEGGERELFSAAEQWAPRVGAILAEIHPPLTVDDASEQLTAFGYQRLPLPPDPRFSELLLVSRRDAAR